MGNEFEFIMLSESSFHQLKLFQNVKVDFEDNQVYEDVDGFQSLRKCLKINRCISSMIANRRVSRNDDL